MSASRKNTEKQILESLADESGLAIIVADGKSAPIDGANNNSMCRALYSSEEFAPRCQQFCGKAFDWATEAGKTVSYECHAGLNCLAVPLKTGEKPLVVIVGRTFLKSANYREATEKALAGEWRVFSPTQFFENVLLTGSPQNLEKIAGRLEKLSDEEKQTLLKAEKVEKTAAEDKTAVKEISRQADEIARTQADEIAKLVEQFHQTTTRTAEDFEKIARKNREEAEEISVWRSLFGALLKLDYRQACVSILDFLNKRYGLTSMIWLEQQENRLETVLAIGEMKARQIQIGVLADDERLLDAARGEMSLELRERKTQNPEGELQIINLFPIAVGGEVRSALAVGDKLNGAEEKRRLAHFCRTVASELEILRLREELSRRILLTRAGQKFNENLKKIDTEDFWLNLTQISAELLRAERASLLIYDEKANRLQPKSLIGVVGDLAGQTIGERVALNVLQSGKSLVVANITETDTAAAPLDWQYKTNSFISYPIMIGERKIAVLNFTDRADRAGFNDFDLELLQAISPQIAVAIDRASLKDKAGEFEQLSVTDALTGLLNRRYMEVRLAEEIKRSNRDGYPMSFLMIDVDDFGRFNKDFGVLIGDDALRQTVKAMTSTLRGADVAARYGGEEFCILLPQTTLSEAFSIGERIRQSVEKIDFPQRPITVSIGITTFSPDVSTPDTIIKTADEALRQAKEKGKNNVQIYESSVFKQ
jgi:diguanylate cyclase (GGDEF)-like protein